MSQQPFMETSNGRTKPIISIIHMAPLEELFLLVKENTYTRD